jgi:glycosyltransferase involved in cell wall biosynthesis
MSDRSKFWIAARYWAREVPRRTQVAWYNLALRQPKAISAMVRIRNEEEFLRPSIQSIVEHVEEVVLIDHLSTDRSPQLISELAAEHSQKVKAVSYPYEVHKYGAENDAHRRRFFARYSPHIMANFYNWCLRQCTRPYVLKWDADMIATDGFHRALESFRQTDGKDVMMFAGVNLHPDMDHLLAPVEGDMNDSMVRTLHQSYVRPDAVAEPRLFPRRLAHYDSGFWFCERLLTPFMHHPSHVMNIEQPCYLHMKYCKPNPYNNMSSDLERAIAANIKAGEPVAVEVGAAIERWDLRRQGRQLERTAVVA